jgi:TonB family protein
MKRVLLVVTWYLAVLGALIAATDSVPMPIESERGLFDQPPVPISMARPQFPFEMRRKGVEGEVTVEFTIAVDGRVRGAKVVEATHKDFHRSALAAVESARFKPATKQGQAVAVRVRMPLYYRLGPPVAK